MKLQTSIKPRRDGSVGVTTAGGAVYRFLPDAAGDLCCEVEAAADIAFLLAPGDFFPASEADNDQAMALLQAAGGNDGDDGDDGDEFDLDDVDDDFGTGSAPLEANTPPAPQSAAQSDADADLPHALMAQPVEANTPPTLPKAHHKKRR